MGADILERLDFMMISRRSDEDAIIRDARAEIVRLRGEVAALLEDPDEAELAYRCGDPDSDAIAPAEAKGEVPSAIKWCTDNGVPMNSDWRAGWDACRVEYPDRALGCGACGDGCVGRNGCRVAEESPQPAGGEAVADVVLHDGLLYGRLRGDLPVGTKLYTAPAAVPAGEAVASDDARRHAASLRGISSHIRACPPYEKLRGDADCIDAAADFILRTPQPADGEAVARPMETAPRDGTMVRLLVSFTEHATEDSPDPSWTIGANNFDHDGEDRWLFAGWCWTHDHFTQGQGTPIGWLPMLDTTTPPAPVQAAPQEGEAKRLIALIDAEISYNRNRVVGGRWSVELDEARKIAVALAANPSACELGAVR